MIDKIKYEKVKYNINREAAKISALSSGKINKYDLKRKDTLSSNHKQIIVKAKFTYSQLGKAFEKQQKQLKIKEINKLK